MAYMHMCAHMYIYIYQACQPAMPCRAHAKIHACEDSAVMQGGMSRTGAPINKIHDREKEDSQQGVRAKHDSEI